jgi:hypothetical protein
MLWSNGYRVLETTTGREALVAGNHYDGPIIYFSPTLPFLSLLGPWWRWS